MTKKAIWEYLFPKIYNTNFLLAMKITTVLAFCLSVQITAGVYSQDARLTLRDKENTMAEVIDAIENQTEYKIFYRTGQFDTQMPVLLTSTDQTVASVLNEAFSGSHYTYKLLDKIIVIAPAETSQQSISGTITDAESGDPLPGVNVIVEGTTVGVVSDANGKYSVQLQNPSAVLIFSYVGYTTQRVEVSGRTQMDVVLTPDVKSLDEIVVVGYGTQKKSDITGSITSVDVDKIRDVPASNLTKALQGKTAGVEIQNIGRQPGSSTQIRIRGNRSLGAGNDPLVVVDGIPFGGSLSDIAMDDIASFEVLKDASATVIYGSRGSNGVIIITTKKGKSGALKVSYNGYHGITAVAREYDVYDAEGFVKLRSAANWTTYLSDEKESMINGRETNWQDLIYRSGQTMNHELNFSGGSEKSQYSLSGGYFNETGVLPSMAYSRFNLRMAIDQKIGKRVRMGITSMNAFAITDGQSANPMYSIVSLSPLTVPYNNNGTVKEQPSDPQETTYNPLTLLDNNRWDEQNRRNSSFNTMYVEVDILNGLKYRANLGFDFNTNKYNNFYGSNTQFKQGSENTARVSNTDNLSYTVENMLIYDKDFGKHHIGFTGMQSIQENTSTNSTIDATGLPADYLQYNNLSLADVSEASKKSGNYYSDWRLISFMGRINYSFADRYLITLTGRSDGSSRLAEGKKWHSYPALAVGWRISQEPFMHNISFLSNLKLRAGYGQTSNTSIDPYKTLGGLSQTVYSFGPDNVTGFYVSTLPNTELTWEYTEQTNIGLDFGFFNERINGSIEAYLQTTDGVLLPVSLPASQGVPGQYLKNIGSTENKGLEFSINALILSPSSQDRLSWELNTNVFLNREKITALQDESVKQDIGNGWFVGEPSSAIYDYVKQGIWQIGEEEAAAVYGAKPGDLKLQDLDNNGQINDADRKVIGSSQPKLMGGFTSTWGFKGFDLSVVGYYRVGGTIASTLHMPNNYINRLDGRRNQIEVNYWTPQNPSNDMPRPDANINASRTNVLGYFDGSFLKIRSINLGYNLDSKYTRFLGADSKLRIYASMTDPFILFSPYLDNGGLDPEPTNNASTDNNALSMPSRTLVVGLGTPPVRKFIFGINVKF